MLLGGNGDDLLVGNGGRDALIGGLGADRILGNAEDDILVGGTTDYDGNAAALRAIMAEWTSERTYDERVYELREGSDGLNEYLGDYLHLLADITVHDDNAKDVLTGCAGSDWFFANLSLNGDDADRKDKITGLDSDEYPGRPETRWHSGRPCQTGG